jgi:spoIIIJ-associated protein
METQTTQPGRAPQPEIFENCLRRMEGVLKEIIRLSRLQLTVTIRKASPEEATADGSEWVVDFAGRDQDMLLEARAELLDALAYIASKAVRLDEDLYRKIVFDCQNYRRIRAEELKLTAKLAAERVAESGEPFALNPMSATDRRLIHLALKDQPGVRTESQGMGAARHVVILPASRNS